MPKTLALFLASALVCLAIVPAADAASVVRKPTKVEKRGIKKYLRNHHAAMKDLKAIIVHRKHPKYAAACFNNEGAGFEGTVLKRVSKNRWRFVTGGSGWDGNRTVRQLLPACAAAASPE